MVTLLMVVIVNVVNAVIGRNYHKKKELFAPTFTFLSRQYYEQTKILGLRVSDIIIKVGSWLRIPFNYSAITALYQLYVNTVLYACTGY